ncbi:hypothetical protein Y032_0732g1911 [Ancylostoma ceylanicum]|uniref:Uncharacterized protein n=1 Tax=Ancylostoma ceylanicum TaxID=53326 RepID=A0A016WFZ6_9BILA|nr:hypothetical protein Y032_0732g1911 [Ancylostoma ceylanicum]
MTIPVRYIKRHKSGESSALERVEVAKIWSPEVDRSKSCWLPATVATLADFVTFVTHRLVTRQKGHRAARNPLVVCGLCEPVLFPRLCLRPLQSHCSLAKQAILLRATPAV